MNFSYTYQEGAQAKNFFLAQAVLEKRGIAEKKCLSGYRYAFNGKEQDPEWNGGGNMYDYGFRIYDPRIAKFLSVDPLASSYPWYTPYQFAGNKPIVNMDLDGLEDYNYMDELIKQGTAYVTKVAVNYTKKLVYEAAVAVGNYASEKVDDAVDEISNGKVVLGGNVSATGGGVKMRVALSVTFTVEGDYAATFNFDADAVVGDGKLKFVTKKTDVKAGGSVTYVYDNAIQDQLKSSGILQDIVSEGNLDNVANLVASNLTSKIESDVSAYGFTAKASVDPTALANGDVQVTGSAGFALTPEVTGTVGTKSIGIGLQKTLGGKTVKGAKSVVKTDLDPTPKVVSTVDLLSFTATVSTQDNQSTTSTTSNSTSSSQQSSSTSSTNTTK